MLFLYHTLHIFTFLVAIVFCCYLFTNAIEYIGDKLKFGTNATGCILTVIGTSLPETIVPIVAILSAVFFDCNLETSKDIALGAIIGSPFMLSCFALFLIGIILLIKKRNELELDYKNAIRDYKYFLLGYIIAISTTFLPSKIRYISIILLIALYCAFVYRTIVKSKECYVSEELDELILFKIFPKFSKTFLMYFQAILSVLGLIVFSRLFVHEISWFSYQFNISPIILSLVVTPFATELPECVNSVIWCLDKKDDLAFANVLGAVVFQSSILSSIGIILTPWNLDRAILINALLVIVFSFIFLTSVLVAKKIKLIPLLLGGVFYFGFFALILFLKL